MNETKPKDSEQDPDGKPQGAAGKRRGLKVPALVFFAVILLALILHRCYDEPPPLSDPRHGTGQALPPAPAPAADSAPVAPVLPTPDKIPAKRPGPAPRRPKPPDSIPAAKSVAAPDSAMPYVYADPWGGRHFDSVTVTLHCRENCLILYSFEDSVHFKSYETPFTFKRNTTLWISGLDSLNRQVTPTRIEYVIERNPGACAGNSMPVDVAAAGAGGAGAKGQVCMDVYEWPNREGEFPRAFANWKQAADSCKSVGKRLCTLDEWQAGCHGPDRETYPYGGKYNENHCPAKEIAPARGGRFAACRSYYGLYDMTGNLWEWTATKSRDNDDFYLVAGGNWNGGNQATCGLAKFSFYPNVGYAFVGFRCCEEPAKK
jgi:hypothetical protein